MDKLLTEPQTAAYLAVHRVTLAQWRLQGVGPSYATLAHGRIRYLLSDVEAFVMKQRRPLNILPAPQGNRRQKIFHGLTDDQWAKVEDAFIDDDRGARSLWLATKVPPRQFIDDVLAAAWEGDWPEAPEESDTNFGPLQSRANDWSKRGMWELVFTALKDDPSFPFSLCQQQLILADDPRHSRNRRFLCLRLTLIGRNSRAGASQTIRKLLHRREAP